MRQPPLLALAHQLLVMSSNTEQARKRVIVIGAGFSGLSVAYHLRHNEAFDVQILEARNRLGGRVHPYDLGGTGTTVDLGGQWVHEASKKNPIRQLMKELEIPFQNDDHRLDSSNLVYDSNGQLMDRAKVRLASKIFYKAMEAYEERNVDIHTSYRDLLDRATKNDARFESADFVQAMNYVIHRNEGHEGGRMHELSVHLTDMYKSLGGPDEVPKGGYNAVMNAVAEKIGLDKFRLESIVESIDYDPTNQGTVTVTLESGESILGDYCVCTVPLGVLQHRKICFTPPLSKVRLQAVDSIGMGLLDKIALLFPRVFWGHGYFGSSNTDPTRSKNFYDCTPDVGAPVLLAFMGGDAARRIDSPNGLSDEEAVAETMEILRRIYGSDVPDPVATKVTRWNLDQFAYGAYSFSKVGCTEEAYDEIALPIGNLLFAGEHTSKRQHACVHGAWQTGQRESLRLVRLLSDAKKVGAG